MRISILILGLKALKVNKKNFDHIQLSNACRKIRIKPPEGDQFGRGSTLFHSERRPNAICYVYLRICFWANAK